MIPYITELGNLEQACRQQYEIPLITLDAAVQFPSCSSNLAHSYCYAIMWYGVEFTSLLDNKLPNCKIL